MSFSDCINLLAWVKVQHEKMAEKCQAFLGNLQYSVVVSIQKELLPVNLSVILVSLLKATMQTEGRWQQFFVATRIYLAVRSVLGGWRPI